MLPHKVFVLSFIYGAGVSAGPPEQCGSGDLRSPDGLGACLRGSDPASGYELQIQINEYDNGGNGGVGYMDIQLTSDNETISCVNQRFTTGAIDLLDNPPPGRPLWVNTFDCQPLKAWALVDAKLCGSDEDDQAMQVGIRTRDSTAVMPLYLSQVARIGGCSSVRSNCSTQAHAQDPPPYGPQVPTSPSVVLKCMRRKCSTQMTACDADAACASGLNCTAQSIGVDHFMNCLTDHMSAPTPDVMGCLVSQNCMDVNETGYDLRFRDECVLDCNTERRVKHFYEFYNRSGDNSTAMPGTSAAPSLSYTELQPLFTAYKGREIQLLIDLIDKYGPDPSMENGGTIEEINSEISALKLKDFTGEKGANQALGFIGGFVPIPFFGQALTLMETIWGWILGDDPWGFKARAKGVLLNKKANAQIAVLNYMKLQQYYKDPARAVGTWIFRARSFARVPSFDPFGQNMVFTKWDILELPKPNSTVVGHLEANDQFEVTQFVPLIHECDDKAWACMPVVWVNIRKTSGTNAPLVGWAPVSAKERCLEPQSIRGDGRPLFDDPTTDYICQWWYLTQLSSKPKSSRAPEQMVSIV